MENASSVDQKLLAFLQQHTTLLAAQGTVVASWRHYGGHRLGPYFRLTWRDAKGRQCSRYLGTDRDLAAGVEAWLSELRAPRQAIRQFKEAGLTLRRALRQERVLLRQMLAKFGLSLKGGEVRGWRYARPPVGLVYIHIFSPEQRTGRGEIATQLKMTHSGGPATAHLIPHGGTSPHVGS